MIPEDVDARTAAWDFVMWTIEIEGSKMPEWFGHTPDNKTMNAETEEKVARSERLRNRARNWGLELREAVGPWETDPEDPDRWWLRQDKQCAEAENVIAEARFNYWKRRVSLIALGLSITALVLQIV